MNPQKGTSAAERLREVSQEELRGMLIENSDEPYADEIAKAVVSRLKRGQKIETTTQLKNVIEETLAFLPASEPEGRRLRNPVREPFKRCVLM